jgi:hypothetical protein
MSRAPIQRLCPNLTPSGSRRLSHVAVLLAVAILPGGAVLAHGQPVRHRVVATASPAPISTPFDQVSLAPIASPMSAPVVPIAAAVEDTSIAGLVRAAAIRHGADPVQLLRVASCESGLNPGAYNSRSGASGLFQFMPRTFYAHGGTNIWSAAQQADIAAVMFAAGWSYEWSCR